MYLERHENMDGFWGDLKRKVKKNVKKIGIASAFIPGIGINAAAIAKPVETALVVGSAGAAAGAGAGAGAAGGLIPQAEKYIAKAKKVKASFDAAKAAFKSPQTSFPDYAEVTPEQAPQSPWYENQNVVLGGAALALMLLASR